MAEAQTIGAGSLVAERSGRDAQSPIGYSIQDNHIQLQLNSVCWMIFAAKVRTEVGL